LQFCAMIAASWASIATSRARYPACRPPPLPHVVRGWDATCASTPGLSVTLTRDRARIRLPMTSKNAGPCQPQIAGIALVFDPSPDVHVTAHATAPMKDSFEQAVEYEDTIVLPYPARCDQLGVQVEHQVVPIAGRAAPEFLDTKIASCTEAP
jgi:hypothetical protein